MAESNEAQVDVSIMRVQGSQTPLTYLRSLETAYNPDVGNVVRTMREHLGVWMAARPAVEDGRY